MTPIARKGDRVRCDTIFDSWTGVKPGTEGEVVYIDSLGTLHVRWDDGHRLGLIPGVDHYEVIPKPKGDA
jgi:hypothetical protein